MNSVDMAFRLGYEQGVKDSQVSQMNQAQDQAAQQEQAMAQQGDEGQEGGEEAAPGEEQQAAPDSAHPGGSELDQHIAKLESMLGKNEVQGDAKEDLRKSLKELKSYKARIDLSKAESTIKSIGKSMAKAPFSIGKKAVKNLPEASKQALSMQENIVKDIMSSWEKEEKKASNSIANILGVEGLIKKG